MSVLVYISAPYGGKEENKQKIEEIVKNLAVLHKDEVLYCEEHGIPYQIVSEDYGA